MSQLTNKDGKCYTFDDRGAGYGRGEGLGVLVLKRLDLALANGDAVHAIIVDSGVGHDGKTFGIFLPNAEAQEALARSIYAKAGLDPRETLYVETYGTGTAAGDNAEIQSISKVFGREAGRKSDLPVGSIKTNIGHLESASGVASVIEAVMVLKKNQIPPQLNFINPKPTLHLEERGIKVPLELTSLTPEGHVGPRRVSVNSFGYGGTNAHAILEAFDHAPITGSIQFNGQSDEDSDGSSNGYINRNFNGYSNGHPNGNSKGYYNRASGQLERHSNGPSIGYMNGNINGHSDEHFNNVAYKDGKYHEAEQTLVVLSANSEASLSNVISRLKQWLASDQSRHISFTDLAYTLNVRRSKLPWRCSVVANCPQELHRALGDSKLRPVKSAKGVGVAFIFTGQGAQWFAMGRELTASDVTDLVEELSRDKKTTRLGDSRFSQPCTTAVQIALVDLLQSYGIRPETVCGHSSGEIAAAYAVSALSKESAMLASSNRGVWSSKAKGLNATSGTMLAVGEGEEAIRKRIHGIASGTGKVTVACVNSPESTTISGDLAAIEALQAILDTASVFNRRLQVESA
ncbi:hypothetical protein MMC13_000269 [Lambiella insularis]|nr:hypothetical protein [Lambiella insularis]